VALGSHYCIEIGARDRYAGMKDEKLGLEAELLLRRLTHL